MPVLMEYMTHQAHRITAKKPSHKAERNGSERLQTDPFLPGDESL